MVVPGILRGESPIVWLQGAGSEAAQPPLSWSQAALHSIRARTKTQVSVDRVKNICIMAKMAMSFGDGLLSSFSSASSSSEASGKLKQSICLVFDFIHI